MKQFVSTGGVAKRALRAGIVLGVVGVLAQFGVASAAGPAQQPLCIPGLRMSPAACARQHQLGERRRRPSWMRPRAASAGSTTVYDADPFASMIDVATLTSDGLTPTGEIALTQNSTPIGIAADTKGTLYVAETAFFGPPASPGVAVFPPGATQPSITYTSGLSTPVDVAVDRHGTVYVANIKGGLSGNCDSLHGIDGNVVEFEKGKTMPVRTLNDVPGCPQGVAVDRSGDVFLSFVYTPPSATIANVVEFKAGQSQSTPLNLVGAGGDQFYGMAVDDKNDLVVAGSAQLTMLAEVLTFAPGSTTASSVIQYGGQGWQPQYFGLLGKRLFAPAYISELFLRDAAVFDYPSGAVRFTLDPSLVPPHYTYGFAASP